MKFGELLTRLRTDPEASVRRRGGPSIELIDRSVKAAQSKLASIAKQRDMVWDLHGSGQLRNEDLQERLDRLKIQRDELETQLKALADQRASAQAAILDAATAGAVIDGALRVWTSPKATVDERKKIARAIAIHVGGLYVDRNDELAIGSPPGAPKKKHRRITAAGA